MTCTDLSPDVNLAQGDDDLMREAGSAGYGLHLTPSVPDDCPAGTASRQLLSGIDVCCYIQKALNIMFGVGIPAVVLLAVGIPLVSGIGLWCVRYRLGELEVLATLGFLMNGFRPETNYWEVVIMARKLAVVAITVLVEPWGVRVQTYSALAVIFAAGVLRALHFPFSNRELNALELTALCCAFVTFEGGLFLKDPNSGTTTVVAATVMVFFSNFAVFCSGLFVIRSQLWSCAMRFCHACQPRGRRWQQRQAGSLNPQGLGRRPDPEQFSSQPDITTRNPLNAAIMVHYMSSSSGEVDGVVGRGARAAGMSASGSNADGGRGWCGGTVH